ncbi:MAG TPA: hypothetical protein PKI19_07535, partial [Elusimicrobiales bacterium]|nr:hypothetical protein [Elusimicrobiales bacterium]
SYHRRQELPAAVDGCVLMLDFKHSEKLFRLGTRLGIGGELVAKALTEAWEAVSSAGGEVIQTEGDALTALLERRPAEADAGLAARAVGAVAGVRAALDGLAVSYRARGLLGPKESIEFRAACSLGRLRPAWREIGATRQPFWLESGGTNALVDTARLMELERKAPGDADASRFVSPASIPGLGEERLLGSKHGVRHHVRVLLIPSRI